MELLILISFFLLFSIPLISLIYLSATQSSQDAALSQARHASRRIIETADSVYIGGEGASGRLVVVFPHNLQGIRAEGRELTLVVLGPGGNSDVVAMGIGRIGISSDIETTAGPHSLVLRSLGDRVEISEG